MCPGIHAGGSERIAWKGKCFKVATSENHRLMFVE
jgi:hypothetical protein